MDRHQISADQANAAEQVRREAEQAAEAKLFNDHRERALASYVEILADQHRPAMFKQPDGSEQELLTYLRVLCSWYAAERAEQGQPLARKADVKVYVRPGTVYGASVAGFYKVHLVCKNKETLGRPWHVASIEGPHHAL